MSCACLSKIGRCTAELWPVEVLTFRTLRSHYVTPRSSSRSNHIFLKSWSLGLSIGYAFSNKIRKKKFGITCFSKVTVERRSRSKRKIYNNLPRAMPDHLQKTPCRYLLRLSRLSITDGHTDRHTYIQTCIHL